MLNEGGCRETWLHFGDEGTSQSELRTDSFPEFFQVDLGVSVSVDSSDYAYELFPGSYMPYASQEPLQVGLVNVFVMPVVNDVECCLHCEIVGRF